MEIHQEEDVLEIRGAFLKGNGTTTLGDEARKAVIDSDDAGNVMLQLGVDNITRRYTVKEVYYGEKNSSILHHGISFKEYLEAGRPDHIKRTTTYETIENDVKTTHYTGAHRLETITLPRKR